MRSSVYRSQFSRDLRPVQNTARINAIPSLATVSIEPKPDGRRIALSDRNGSISDAHPASGIPDLATVPAFIVCRHAVLASDTVPAAKFPTL
jgi:hypothetical protein